MYEIVALMPMRHYSARVNGKNYRPFGNGLPLFFHMANNLLNSKLISKVVIDTDSPIIKEACKEKFPSILLIDRPKSLSDENCSMNEILLYDVNKVESKFYLQTHSTNPLLSLNTIDKSLEFFINNYPSFDSLFSVTKKKVRYWDEMARPINHNPNILMRTQDLPPIYEENSCIYIFERNNLIRNQNRIGKRPFLFELDSIEAIDIDEEKDFQLAENFFKLQK